MIRRIAYRLWVTTAALLLVLALLVSLARVLLPQVADYRAQLITLLSEQLGLPLEVDAIDAQWHGLGPRIRFAGLTLLDRADRHPLLSLEDAVIDIDLPHTLWRGSLQISDLALGGVRLAVTRHADGSLTVLGLKSGQAPEIGVRDLLRWLASRKRIALRDTVIDWRDEMNQGVVRHFHEVSFHLRNDGSRHQLEGQALLAETSRQGVSFAMDVRGDVLEAGGWDADIYMAMDALQLESLPWPLQFGGVRFAKGNATLQIWGNWSRARLQRLEGRLALRSLALGRTTEMESRQPAAPAASPLVIDELGGDFVWLGRAAGWQLAVEGLRFARKGRRWSPGSLQLAVAGEGAAANVTAQVGYLDLGDVRHLLRLGPALPEELAGPLAGLRPSGRIRDAYLHYRGGYHPRFHLAGRFEDVGFAPWRGVPGLEGLSGHLVADDEGGMVELQSGAASVDFAGLFRDTLAMDRVAGRCYWRRGEQGWRLLGRDLDLANADLSLRADLELTLPASGAAPRLDLAADFSAFSLEHTSRYLPVAVMRPGLVKWLDGAIVAGRVPAGEVGFHGTLEAGTFDKGGLFEVRFNVLDGVLKYASGWPRIEEIEAGFLFHNRRLDVQLAAGKSLSSAIDEARISIADLTAFPALLAVEGRAQGPTADALRFLRESPLQDRFAAYLADMNAFGHSRLDL
ncbi:MAG: YhdP family protein, partial [Gammaproteobacteria bacterium]